jgi:hypothetical protein
MTGGDGKERRRAWETLLENKRGRWKGWSEIHTAFGCLDK